MEIELKLGLKAPADLPRLLDALPAPARVIQQHNVYLADPDGALDAARIMLRVRTEQRSDGDTPQVVVTAKRKKDATAGVFRSEEHEAPLDAAIWRAVQAGERELAQVELEPILWARAEAGFDRLTVRTSMTNERHVIPWQGFTLEVDRTTFGPGDVEAEIECETDDPTRIRAALDALLAELGVAVFEQTRSKFHRLLDRQRG